MGILDKQVLEALKATPLTRENAAALYHELDQIAKSLGIKTPAVHLVPRYNHSSLVLYSLSNSANAAALSRETIIVNQPILDLFKSTNLSKTLPAEMKAILGHEMHHCANHKSMVLMSRGPVAILPAAAMIGLYLYDKAHSKAQKEGTHLPEHMVKHVEAAAEEERKNLPAEAKHPFMDRLIKAGEYIAVMAISTGAGLWVARHGARFHEFAADRFGASVAGKENMISALRKLATEAGHSVSEHHQAERFQGILNETILSHPSFAERRTNILR